MRSHCKTRRQQQTAQIIIGMTKVHIFGSNIRLCRLYSIVTVNIVNCTLYFSFFFIFLILLRSIKGNYRKKKFEKNIKLIKCLSIAWY